MVSLFLEACSLQLLKVGKQNGIDLNYYQGFDIKWRLSCILVLKLFSFGPLAYSFSGSLVSPRWMISTEVFASECFWKRCSHLNLPTLTTSSTAWCGYLVCCSEGSEGKTCVFNYSCLFSVQVIQAALKGLQCCLSGGKWKFEGGEELGSALAALKVENWATFLKMLLNFWFFEHSFETLLLFHRGWCSRELQVWAWTGPPCFTQRFSLSMKASLQKSRLNHKNL